MGLLQRRGSGQAPRLPWSAGAGRRLWRAVVLATADLLGELAGRLRRVVSEPEDRGGDLASASRALERRVVELQTLLDVIPIGIAVADDPECRRITPNPALARLLRVPPGGNFSKTAPPGEQPAFTLSRDGRELHADELTLQAAMRQGVRIENAELQIAWPDGTSRQLLEWAAPVFDEGGRVRGGFLAVVDITERKRAELAHRRLAAIVESSADAIVGTTLDGVVTSWNAAAERIYGYAAEEIVGRSVAMLVPPDRAHEVPELIRRLGRGERIEAFETARVHKDGRRIDLSLTISPITDGAGRVTGHSAIGRDITARKQAEAALRESEARLHAILDHSPAIIYVKDRAGRYVLANRRFEVLERRTDGPVVGRTDEELFAADIAAAFRGNDLKVLEAGLPLEFEELAPHADGLHTSISIKFPLRDAEGAVYALCGISTDITARKRTEEALRDSEARLRQAQKMEAIGQLAGGIAHDFNNLLTAITGYSDLLLARLDRESAAYRDVAEIKRAADRGGELIQQVLAFSRRQVLQPTVLDLNTVLADLTPMLRRVIGETIALTTVPEPGLGRVEADRSQLEQVVMNLVVNARDAMPAGGRVVIETANVELTEADLRRDPGGEAGSYVRLAVTDTGCGMDAATQTRIFEPFFTTKPRGKGTGLGLATVYGIVKQSGGHLSVHSEPGRGTTFTILLPRADEAAEVPAQPECPAGAVAARASETILLVEDDEAVRALTRRTLEEAGYRVLEAVHGEEALRVADAQPDTLSLVLTDIVMPGVGGIALAQRLSVRRPGLKVLYMSGYADHAGLRQGHLEPGSAFLGKPFTPRALLRAVRRMLDARVGEGAQP